MTIQPTEDRTPQPGTSLRDQIRSMEAQFALAMPKGAEAAQLVRDALTCIQKTPKLLDCVPQTVLGALMSCAQLGLRPGVAGLGHAWVLPYWDSKFENPNGRRGAYVAQLIIGYKGYVDLAYRSGQIATVIGRTVYDGDTFDVEYGLDDKLIHKPALAGDRTTPVAHYAIVKLANGGRYDIEAHLRFDSSASQAFAEAHVRRLEAIRRVISGVIRQADGSWLIAPDHLERAAAYETARVRERPVSVSLLSSRPLEALARADAATWLDTRLAAPSASMPSSVPANSAFAIAPCAAAGPAVPFWLSNALISPLRTKRTSASIPRRNGVSAASARTAAAR